ncbi:nitrilase-related carbon-nitrogen hydrolase [Streptomyces sp. GLT-R25]
MRIAIGQLTTGPDPDKNLRLVEEWTRRAADAGARVVVFPEASMACFGTPLAPLAQSLDGPWADGVREIARATGTVVVAGMFTPADEGRVANTLLATGPGVEESYDKIHLYDAFGFRESETVAPGSRPAVIDVDGVRLGLATCYDVRFPELFRAHADAGAVGTLLAASWGADLANWVGDGSLTTSVRRTTNDTVKQLTTLGALALIALVAVAVLAVRAVALRPEMRRNTGIAWAFGVFWPRAAHPFAPAAWTVRC